MQIPRWVYGNGIVRSLPSSHRYRYGFVEFTDRMAAMKAYQFNNHQLGAGNIRVSQAKSAITKPRGTFVPQNDILLIFIDL